MKKIWIGLFALLLASQAIAANVNIDGLPAASASNGTDLLECEQGGVNNKCTAAQVAAYVYSLMSGAATSTGGGAVTLANMAALSLKGNATNASATPTDIATTSGSNFPLRENGSGALSFGPLNGGFALNNNSTPLNKLANGTANTIIGATSAAAHVDLSVPSCSAATNALIWTAGTGPGCATFGALVNVTPGTGVATALAVNVGTAGAVVVNGGALGTPSSGTLTSATGLPISTGVSGLGTGVATALAAATSSAGGMATVVASGTAALGTGAISSGACATVVTVSATNVATTDVVLAGFNGDPTAVTGYIPSTSGMLTIIPYPTAGNVNFKTCNNTASSVTPGAVTLNWRVVR